MGEKQNKNKYLKDSKLICHVDNRYGKTRLASNRFSAPLKIARPMIDEGDWLNLCILNASPGLFSGDKYNIEFHVSGNSHLKVTAQSYTLVHKATTGKATQNITLMVGSGSELIFFPQPTVPYSGSIFEGETVIKTKTDSKLIFTEILSCGRYKRDEIFDFSSYKNRLTMYVDNECIFRDITALVPDTMDFESIGVYEQYLHQGAVILQGYSKDEVDTLAEEILSDRDKFIFGTTLLSDNKAIYLRLLGKSAEQIRMEIKKLIENLSGTTML